MSLLAFRSSPGVVAFCRFLSKSAKDAEAAAASTMEEVTKKRKPTSIDFARIERRSGAIASKAKKVPMKGSGVARGSKGRPSPGGDRNQDFVPFGTSDSNDIYRSPGVPFRFSFKAEDRQVVLRTGTVLPRDVESVRRSIREHSDFSADVDRKKLPVEAYFMRLAATSLARNPKMSVDDKRDIISSIREKITTKRF